VITGNWVCEKY